MHRRRSVAVVARGVETVVQTRSVVRNFWNLWGLLP